MPGIKEALDEISTLKPDEKLVYAAIAQKHGVDRSTLSRVHRLNQVPRHVANDNQRKLSHQQEADPVKYIEELTARRIPPTRAMVRNFASSVASSRVSDSWVTRFLHRHRDQANQQSRKWNEG